MNLVRCLRAPEPVLLEFFSFTVAVLHYWVPYSNTRTYHRIIYSLSNVQPQYGIPMWWAQIHTRNFYVHERLWALEHGIRRCMRTIYTNVYFLST